MPFLFKKMTIPDVVLITPQKFGDARGYFLEVFKSSDFENAGIESNFVQENQSLSKKDVIRGLHFQIPPAEQGKLVRVVTGSIFDVAVDIREGSPFFGQWVGVILSSQNMNMLWIPPGFAHGFCALEDNTTVVYLITKEYNPSLEGGIIWNDPDININWPTQSPKISAKDQKLKPLSDYWGVFKYNLQ